MRNCPLCRYYITEFKCLYFCCCCRPNLAMCPDIVVGTPSRVLACIKASLLDLSTSLQWLVLDEADLLHTFGYERDIKSLMGHINNTYQSLLLSATLTEVAQMKLMVKFCLLHKRLRFRMWRHYSVWCCTILLCWIWPRKRARSVKVWLNIIFVVMLSWTSLFLFTPCSSWSCFQIVASSLSTLYSSLTGKDQLFHNAFVLGTSKAVVESLLSGHMYVLPQYLEVIGYYVYDAICYLKPSS